MMSDTMVVSNYAATAGAVLLRRRPATLLSMAVSKRVESIAREWLPLSRGTKGFMT